MAAVAEKAIQLRREKKSQRKLLARRADDRDNFVLLKFFCTYEKNTDGASSKKLICKTFLEHCETLVAYFKMKDWKIIQLVFLFPC